MSGALHASGSGRAGRRLAGAVLVAACVPANSEDASAPFPMPSRYPPIAVGDYSPADRAGAERLIDAAREALAVREYSVAQAAASQIVDQYPSAPGASEALWVLAFAAHAEGDYDEAAETAGALTAVLGDAHPAFPDAQDLRAAALFDAGDLMAAAETSLSLPEHAYTEAAAARVEAAVASLDRDQLTELAAGALGDGPKRRFGPVFAELALVTAFVDDPGPSRSYAQRASEVGATGRAARIAAAVLAGDLSGLGSAAPVIGVVLPFSGPPTNRAYAESFWEGVEVASAMASRAGVHVEVVREDNRGTRRGSARGARAVAARGAVAILGPLRDSTVLEAARAKPSRVPLFSPTARRVPEAGSVYSLGAASPLAARTLAGALAELGFANAVVLHGSGHGEVLEARAFQHAFAAVGGQVDQSIQYSSGSTTFLEPLREVEALQPELLVVLATETELELLAPQMSFMGLDTLGIQVAGTTAWSSPALMNAVAQRHTDRVIAVGPVLPGSREETRKAFRAEYENRFRKTLQDEAPAVGFDLFRIALAAYGEGVRRVGGAARGAERVAGVRGATGIFSVVDGRLEREAFPVRLFEGGVLPLDAELPELPPRGPPPRRATVLDSGSSWLP